LQEILEWNLEIAKQYFYKYFPKSCFSRRILVKMSVHLGGQSVNGLNIGIHQLWPFSRFLPKNYGKYIVHIFINLIKISYHADYFYRLYIKPLMSCKCHSGHVQIKRKIIKSCSFLQFGQECLGQVGHFCHNSYYITT